MPYLKSGLNNFNSFGYRHLISSAESQKGAINLQRCSVENQNGANAMHRLCTAIARALLVLNGTYLNIVIAPRLALNWRYSLFSFPKCLNQKALLSFHLPSFWCGSCARDSFPMRQKCILWMRTQITLPLSHHLQSFPQNIDFRLICPILENQQDIYGSPTSAQNVKNEARARNKILQIQELS